VAASSQLPPVKEVSAAQPTLDSEARGPTGPALNGHQQTSLPAEAVRVGTAVVAGGSAPNHAPTSPDSRERVADGDRQQCNPEQQPANQHVGPANSPATPRGHQGTAGDVSDLRPHPAPPSPRKWWFGLAKRTMVA